MTLHNWPHLYKSSVVDVTDVAEGIAKDQGGFYAQAEQAVKDGKQYLAVPFGVNGLLIAYRKSWFKEAGAETPPKTLDEYRQLGTRLKKKGHPIGQTLEIGRASCREREKSGRETGEPRTKKLS